MTSSEVAPALAGRLARHPEQAWTVGRRPAHAVEYDDERRLWNVYGHAEARTVLTDTTLYSSDLTPLFPALASEELTRGNLIQMDPPDHRGLRRLVSHAFGPGMVAGLEPRIRDIGAGLLDGWRGRDHGDVVTDLAYPLPVIVIAELLGVPSGDRTLFRRWADILFESSNQFSLHDPDGSHEREMRDEVDRLAPMYDYLRDHVRERRRRPRADLLGELVAAEVDGVRLDDQEIVNFAGILLVAGHITTTMMVGNTVLTLLERPELRRRVVARPELLPMAIEESIRLLTPFSSVGRRTTRAARLGDRDVPAGQMILVWLGAANRDPARFECPDDVDLDRAEQHLAFGRGVHFCLGAPLARLEGRVLLELLLDRHPDLEAVAGDPPEFVPSPNMMGLRRLPVRWGPTRPDQP